ncbi:Dnaaf1 [Symbiodinium necroappetens]|uniref:Dnaaf1 protein n=1 Tax=Symbiodinium necroappetens TaxID=1628268 RepID=A0A812IL97_9DINO|nr:Dnaaf1 [Symbiodinium necroappetens]
MDSEEEEDADWFCVLQPVAVRAAPRESAARRGSLVAGQRIQVRPGRKQDADGNSWIRLTLLELWRSCRATSRTARGFVPLADQGFPVLRGPLTTGECPLDSEQLVGFLRWWPLDPLPPMQPATFGGSWLCHWETAPGQDNIKARWLSPGELQLVGPAGTKAGEVCGWLEEDIGFGADFSVVLIQDLPGLGRCSPITAPAVMHGVHGAAALKSARAALLALSGEDSEPGMPGQLAAKHRELAKAALRKDGRALEALDTLRADSELVHIALENDARALQFAAEDLRDDAELVLAAVRRRGQVLRWASERLRGERHVVLTAIDQDPRAVMFASEELARDKEVLLAAMSKDPSLAVHLANVARGIA